VDVLFDRFKGLNIKGILNAIGNTALLASGNVTFFCSTEIPGEAILKIFDWANGLRGKSLTVISGFHTPMEKEVWRILQRDPAQKPKYIVARSLPMRHLADWADLFAADRLLGARAAYLWPDLHVFYLVHRLVMEGLAQWAGLRGTGTIATTVYRLRRFPGGSLPSVSLLPIL